MDLEKLLSKEKLCITDKPSPCIAQCPIHVDIKTFIAEVSEGNLKKAYKTLAKRVPIPRIICNICDHPCEEVCIRKDLGGAISIGALEKAVIKHGYGTPKKEFPIPKNGKTVAVVGGGISGLTVALDLDKKGYAVTIFEEKAEIGGRMWNFQLPPELLKEELEHIKKGKISIRFNSKVGEEELQKISKDYDAVCIDTGEWHQDLEISDSTFQTKIPGVFAGGTLVNKNDSVIYSISTGRRAAVSVDRYIQKISMTASRENEGSYTTPLTLNTENIEKILPINRSDKGEYSEQEAVLEAKRCIRCQCLECVNSCVHLKKFKMTPKSYIRSINHNEAIILGDHHANKMINSCSLCGLCGEVCPSKLNIRDIIIETRQSMVEKEKMPPSAHDFALKDMEFSNSDKFTLLKHQPGFERSSHLFFPGCQLSASSPEYISKIYSYLTTKIKDGVGIMLGCCGAPAEWSGRKKEFEASIKNTIEKWESMGKPSLILACSTCSNIFRTYIPEINCVSLWEFMDKSGIPQENSRHEYKTLSIHDACTTRYDSTLQDSVRKIIKKLGHSVKELKFSREKTKCCGYGGLIYYANKEQSKEFIKDRINEAEEDYVVYCSMCRDLFSLEGKRAFHILDLIYGEDLEKLGERKGPKLWERRLNRTKVKEELLKLYGESIHHGGEIAANIILSESIEEKMEDKLILLQDVEKVIKNAESNVEKFVNPNNGHFLARKRLANVTYWVEYEYEQEKYLVHNVYSHRMEVLEG